MKFKRGRFLLLSLAIIICLVLGTLFYASYDAYYGPVPKTSGEENVSGLAVDVTIYRDSWGIPQIYANSVADLFFAQGYTHAQDRWWQMELTRKLGRGQLSQVVGANSQIQGADRLLQTLDWVSLAEIEWENASTESHEVLTAYTNGVNAYIAERNADDLAMEYSLLALSGEMGNIFSILGQDEPVEPWTPVDSLLWSKMFAWQMAGDWQAELHLAQVYSTTDAELLREYFYPDIVPLQNGQLFASPLLGDLSPELLTILGLETNLQGTAWVLAGQHTTTGKPILANDLQSTPNLPSQWFEMGLHCRQPSRECPYDVVGFSTPGMPGIIVGHNDRIAWGIAPANIDTQDLVLLRLNPANPTQYEWDGQWVDMVQKPISVVVDDEHSREYSGFWTQWGPVLTDIDTLADNQVLWDEPYQAIALHWSLYATSGDVVKAVLSLNRAENWLTFRIAVRFWEVSPLYFTFADVAGNIGSQLAGGIPERSTPNDGLMPSTTSWTEVQDFEALANIFNPPDGIIVHTQFLHEPRLRYLLQTREAQSLDSTGRIQGDVYNTLALELMPYVRRLKTEDAELGMVLEWLGEWTLENDSESPQALLFEVFWIELLQTTFADQMSISPTPNDPRLIAFIQNLLRNPNSIWWDHPETAFTQETRDDILKETLLRSYNQLVENVNEEMVNWTWGEIHQVKFVSRLIGQVDILPLSDVAGIPINRGEYALGGCYACLYQTNYRLNFGEDRTSQVTLIPGYRLIIDLHNFDNSRAMHVPGQSGHPASENYDDMIDPWRTVDYHNMRWGAAIIENAEKQLDLQPGQFDDEGIDEEN